MTIDSPLGEINRGGGRASLRFTRRLAHDPEKVWRALTESEHMRWWMPVDMIGERATGATVGMVFWPDLVERKGLDPDAGTATIQVWDPPSVFEWVWHGSQVRFELEPHPDGCELRLIVEIDEDHSDTIVDNAGGYHLWMDHLTKLLDTGSSLPIADADSQPLQAMYRALLQAG